MKSITIFLILFSLIGYSQDSTKQVPVKVLTDQNFINIIREDQKRYTDLLGSENLSNPNAVQQMSEEVFKVYEKYASDFQTVVQYTDEEIELMKFTGIKYVVKFVTPATEKNDMYVTSSDTLFSIFEAFKKINEIDAPYGYNLECWKDGKRVSFKEID